MLFLELLERMSLIAVAAYIYSQSRINNNLIKEETNFADRIVMVIFFSSLSIIGTYTGIGIESSAIANTRPIGAIAAGYVGGPVIGMAVGMIAGFHRYSMGGYTALACGIATVGEGLIGGIVSKFYEKNKLSIKGGLAAGITAEILQMVMVLTVAKPFSSALRLEKIIAVPMIFVNTLGVVIFIHIIITAREQRNRIADIQAQRVLNIAKRTNSYLRKDFDADTCSKIAEIIYESSHIEGVFIANKLNYFEYRGERLEVSELKAFIENFSRKPDNKVVEFMSNGKKVYFYCVPLVADNREYEGLIGIKADSGVKIDTYFMEFCKELASLLSSQIELNKLNKLAQAASTAELKSLRTQISPHFLFNALNTIASFCRTNPIRARELIIELSNYFRNTLKREEHFATIGEEVKLIESYLTIEKARFGDRLKLEIHIPENMLQNKMPVFVLQQLIENSVKHGILPKPEGGRVEVKAEPKEGLILFSVSDDGVGMSTERYKEVFATWPGIGLKNINERLKLLYGEKYQLSIESKQNIGTKVSFIIPGEEAVNG